MASQGSHAPVRATERLPASVPFLGNPLVRDNYCGITVLISIENGFLISVSVVQSSGACCWFSC